MRAWKVLGITVLMLGGLIALVVGLRGWSGRVVTQYWLDRLDTVPDDRAAALLEQIAALDERGIPILVAALGSPREAVSRAAAEVLAEQLHRWQNPPSPAALRKQMALVAGLAEHMPEFGPAARHEAAQLASRVLLVLPEENVADRARLIAACDKVLQAAAAGQRERPSPAAPAAVATAVRVQDYARRQRDALLPGESIPALAHLPGGGLPVDLFPSADAPRLPCEPAEPQPLDARQGPMKNMTLGGEGAPAAVVHPLMVTQPDPAPRGIARVQPASDLVRADTVELMRQLQSTDEAAVAAARAELIRRRFTPAHLEAARRLFHADPEVRKGLARMLPETPGIDAAPWLLWLARDPEADVRLVAVALLATTADPDVLEQVEAIAGSDPDPRIQQLAERLDRQRKGP